MALQCYSSTWKPFVRDISCYFWCSFPHPSLVPDVAEVSKEARKIFKAKASLTSSWRWWKNWRLIYWKQIIRKCPRNFQNASIFEWASIKASKLISHLYQAKDFWGDLPRLLSISFLRIVSIWLDWVFILMCMRKNAI